MLLYFCNLRFCRLLLAVFHKCVINRLQCFKFFFCIGIWTPRFPCLCPWRCNTIAFMDLLPFYLQPHWCLPGGCRASRFPQNLSMSKLNVALPMTEFPSTADFSTSSLELLHSPSLPQSAYLPPRCLIIINLLLFLQEQKFACRRLEIWPYNASFLKLCQTTCLDTKIATAHLRIPYLLQTAHRKHSYFQWTSHVPKSHSTHSQINFFKSKFLATIHTSFDVLSVNLRRYNCSVCPKMRCLNNVTTFLSNHTCSIHTSSNFSKMFPHFVSNRFFQLFCLEPNPIFFPLGANSLFPTISKSILPWDSLCMHWFQRHWLVESSTSLPLPPAPSATRRKNLFAVIPFSLWPNEIPRRSAHGQTETWNDVPAIARKTPITSKPKPSLTSPNGSFVHAVGYHERANTCFPT